MAARRTEKQNMMRAYEAEQKEKRIQEEFERRQEEAAEEAYYEYQLYKEEQKAEENRRKELERRQDEEDAKICYEFERGLAMIEEEERLRRLYGNDY